MNILAFTGYCHSSKQIVAQCAFAPLHVSDFLLCSLPDCQAGAHTTQRSALHHFPTTCSTTSLRRLLLLLLVLVLLLMLVLMLLNPFGDKVVSVNR